MSNLFVILLSVFAINVYAETTGDEKKGLAIAKEVKSRDSGWGDYTAKMKMTLINKKGQKTIREIRSKNLEGVSSGDKSMSIFDNPRDIKGTAMLTFTNKLEPDDQWLYLPALKRVKRISSRNKSGPFMGSEFAYEDLGSQEVEKYQHFYLGDEVLNGVKTLKNKRIPQYKYSGYTKQINWIDKERYIPLKVEYYDRKGSLLKTLEYTDYQQYLEKYWRADAFTMTNHQNGKKTILSWQNYKFNTGLKNSDFKSNKLKSQR